MVVLLIRNRYPGDKMLDLLICKIFVQFSDHIFKHALCITNSASTRFIFILIVVHGRLDLYTDVFVTDKS